MKNLILIGSIILTCLSVQASQKVLGISTSEKDAKNLRIVSFKSTQIPTVEKRLVKNPNYPCNNDNYPECRGEYIQVPVYGPGYEVVVEFESSNTFLPVDESQALSGSQLRYFQFGADKLPRLTLSKNSKERAALAQRLFSLVPFSQVEHDKGEYFCDQNLDVPSEGGRLCYLPRDNTFYYLNLVLN